MENTAQKSFKNYYAIKAVRKSDKTDLDFFPTPGWATRALMEHVINIESKEFITCLEPACGQGHMARVLAEYFTKVHASDIHPYGYGQVESFIDNKHPVASFDWVITNPPFNKAEEFISEALPIARIGVALLVRTNFLESVGRFNRLFSVMPPSVVAQFSERVPMIKGRVDKKATTATGYAWLVWYQEYTGLTKLKWIPPCRKVLEMDYDYT